MNGVALTLVNEDSLDAVDRVQKLLHGCAPLAHIWIQSIHDRL